MSASQWLIIVFLGVFVFGIYLFIDLAKSNMNAFLDKWVGKTLWIWLPFYALQRLIREVILRK